MHRAATYQQHHCCWWCRWCCCHYDWSQIRIGQSISVWHQEISELSMLALTHITIQHPQFTFECKTVLNSNCVYCVLIIIYYSIKECFIKVGIIFIENISIFDVLQTHTQWQVNVFCVTQTPRSNSKFFFFLFRRSGNNTEIATARAREKEKGKREKGNENEKKRNWNIVSNFCVFLVSCICICSVVGRVRV